MHLDREGCLALLASLVGAGYLTAREDLDQPQHCYNCRTDDCEYHDYRTWTLTPAGRSLAHASGRKPSTRKNADALAAKVAKAAQAVNADPDATLWWVKEIRAVGAYAEPGQEPLLHVDLAVELRPRLDDPLEQRKAEQRLRDAARDRGERQRAWGWSVSWTGRPASVRACSTVVWVVSVVWPGMWVRGPRVWPVSVRSWWTACSVRGMAGL
ncbi:hypothetical protein ACFRFD_37820, partial [Streptomyces sp. NPDC056632]